MTRNQIKAALMQRLQAPWVPGEFETPDFGLVQGFRPPGLDESYGGIYKLDEGQWHPALWRDPAACWEEFSDEPYELPHQAKDAWIAAAVEALPLADLWPEERIVLPEAFRPMDELPGREGFADGAYLLVVYHAEERRERVVDYSPGTRKLWDCDTGTPLDREAFDGWRFIREEEVDA